MKSLLETASSLLELGRKVNESLENLLKVSGEVDDVMNSLSDADKEEIKAFMASNDAMKSYTARNIEIFRLLGFIVE